MKLQGNVTAQELRGSVSQVYKGDPGKDGYTPVKGVDYFDGEDGKDGYTPVKGIDYFDGKDGKDGYTPVKGVDYFDGKDGNDGETPIKGTDYWTEEDKAEIKADCDHYIATELAKRGQLAPEFANSIAECTDQTKMYVLPDGFIYAYVSVGNVAAYTNQLSNAVGTDGKPYNGGLGYKTGWRFNSSKQEVEADGQLITGYIPYTPGKIIRISGFTDSTTPAGYFQTVTSAFAVDKHQQMQNLYGTYAGYTYAEDPTAVGVYMLTIDPTKVNDSDFKYALNDSNTAYIRVNISGYNEPELKVTLDEEISVSSGSGWANTGHAFVPADYENRIVAAERDIEKLKQAFAGDMAVYGIVDSENNIIMTGTLASGTYTLKYQREDGTTTDICNFTMG